jgi:hypothetical protein
MTNEPHREDAESRDERELFTELVTHQRFEPGLAKLFGEKSGYWWRLASLLGDLASKVGGDNSDPWITWIPDPNASRGPDYCLVIAFWDDDYRCEAAVYHRARLQT